MSQPHDPSGQPPFHPHEASGTGPGPVERFGVPWEEPVAPPPAETQPPGPGYSTGDVEDTVIMPPLFGGRDSRPSSAPEQPTGPAGDDPADDSSTVLMEHPQNRPNPAGDDATVLAAPGAGQFLADAQQPAPEPTRLPSAPDGPDHDARPQSYGSAPQSYGSAPQSYGSAPQSYGSAPQSQPSAPQSYGSASQPMNFAATPHGHPQPGGEPASEQPRPLGMGPVGPQFAPQGPSAAAGPGLPPTASGTGAARGRKRRPIWLFVIIGVVLLALIGALAAYFLTRPTDSPVAPAPSASATPTPTPTPTPTKPLPPAPPAILTKDARQVTLPEKVDPWFPKKVQSDPTPPNIRRGQYQTADGVKTLFLDVYVDSSMTVAKRSADFDPDSIKDSANYRCGRLKDKGEPICIADVKDGMVESRGSIKDIQDKTIEDALQTWMKGNQ